VFSATRYSSAIIALLLLCTATHAQQYKLAPATTKALQELANSDAKPIEIEAFLSPAVPREYVNTLKNVRYVLAGFDAAGGGKIKVTVHDVKPYTAEAQEIFEQHKITPQIVSQGIPGVTFDRFVHAHLRVTQDGKTVEVPFQGPFSATELQLRLAVEEVTGAPKRKLAIARTSAVETLLAGRQPDPALQLLEVVYEVKYVDLPASTDKADDKTDDKASDSADASGEKTSKENPAAKEQPQAASLDCDVLLVLQPSTLSEQGVKELVRLIESGVPTAIFEDPSPRIAQVAATGAPQDLAALWAALQIKFDRETIAWQLYRPSTMLDATAKIPVEMMFFDREMPASGGKKWEGISKEDPAVKSLNHIAFFFAGSFTPQEKATLGFVPLATTTDKSGLSTAKPAAPSAPDGGHPPFDDKNHVIAARITSKEKGGVSAAVVADVDCISATLFNRNAQTQRNLPIENPSLLLNLLDSLAGDSRYLEIRSRVAGFPSLTQEERELVKKSDALTKAVQESVQKIQKASEAAYRAEVDKIRKDIAAGGNPVAAQQKLRMLQATAQREMQLKVQTVQNEAKEKLSVLQNEVRNTAKPLISTLIK